MHALSPLLAVALAPIYGGQVDNAHPAVVEVMTDHWVCTGTLIQPTIVLTSAYCVYRDVDAGTIDGGLVIVGQDEAAPDDVILIQDGRYDPDYAHPMRGWPHQDVAVLLLSRPAAVAPLPLLDVTIPTAVHVGEIVTIAGYGVTEESVWGVRHYMRPSVQWFGSDLLGLSTANEWVCTGDDGAPVLLPRPDGEAVAGVVSPSCWGLATATRIDTVRSYMNAQIGSWIGPCSRDGTCNKPECGDTDPDCSSCAPDGVCAGDCPFHDWDCPVIVPGNLPDAGIVSLPPGTREYSSLCGAGPGRSRGGAWIVILALLGATRAVRSGRRARRRPR